MEDNQPDYSGWIVGGVVDSTEWYVITKEVK